MVKKQKRTKTKKKCKARTRQGEKCTQDAIIDGYCTTHFCLKNNIKKKKGEKGEKE